MNSRFAIGFFVLVFCASAFFLLGRSAVREDVAPSVIPPLPEAEVPLGPVKLIVESAPAPMPAPMNSYQLGYENGYRAFLAQSGQPLPPAVSYVSEVEVSEEQSSRGYVDGYHKASEMLQCPRCY